MSKLALSARSTAWLFGCGVSLLSCLLPQTSATSVPANSSAAQATAAAPATAPANMLLAIQAYEKQDYPLAHQQFQQLLTLGNEVAAFNLAVMAYKGQGEPTDVVKAVALLGLAAQLSHPEAAATRQSLASNLTPAQLQQANALQASLLTQIKVLPASLLRNKQPDRFHDRQPRQVLHRVEPKYPKAAAKQGQFGYVSAQLLVDQQGQVQVVDIIDSYPQRVFDEAVVKALLQWQYQPAAYQSSTRVAFTFSLGPLDPIRFNATLDRMQLWKYAATGSPSHQYALGALLNLAEVAAISMMYVDHSLPLKLENLPRELFVNKAMQPVWSGVNRNTVVPAMVRLDDRGVVSAILSEQPSAAQQAMVGQRLANSSTAAGVYYVGFNGNNELLLTAAVTVPASYSAYFWWEAAARGGDLQAQRVMNFYSEQWRRYLVSQQHPAALAWEGVEQFLAGQQDAGMQLLDQAIAAGHPQATTIKARLLPPAG